MNKYIIDFCITNACNLKCSSCDQYCSHSKSWYASFDEIKNWLYLIKNKCKNLRSLEISGGEACLHPNFMEICKLCHELFPNIFLSTTTNGTLLKKSKKELMKLQNDYKIRIRTTLYPILFQNTLTTIIDKNLLKEINLESRPIFYKNSFSKNKTKNAKITFKNCNCLKDPTYFFYKGNFYPCNASIIMQQINNNLVKKNKISLYNMSSEKDLLFLNKENNLCAYCNNVNLSCFDGFYHSLNTIVSNNYFETIKDIFIQDYSKYEQMLIPDSFLIKAMKNPIFLKNLNRDPANDKIFQRFYGKKDFIFLLNEKSNLNYIQQFKADNINLYFILINTSESFDLKIFDFIKNNFELEGYLYKKKSYKEILAFIPKIAFCANQKIINLL